MQAPLGGASLIIFPNRSAARQETWWAQKLPCGSEVRRNTTRGAMSSTRAFDDEGLRSRRYGQPQAVRTASKGGRRPRPRLLPIFVLVLAAVPASARDRGTRPGVFARESVGWPGAEGRGFRKQAVSRAGRLAYQGIHHARATRETSRPSVGGCLVAAQTEVEALPRTFEALWRGPRGLLERPDATLNILALALQDATGAGIGPGHPRTISVNVRYEDLARPDFASQVLHVLHAHRFVPSLLQLEIVEVSGLDARHRVVRRNLSALHEAGVKLAADDVGSHRHGLTNLRHLLELRIVRTFKIDGPAARDPLVRPLVMEVIERANRHVPDAPPISFVLEQVVLHHVAAAIGEVLRRQAQGGSEPGRVRVYAQGFSFTEPASPRVLSAPPPARWQAL